MPPINYMHLTELDQPFFVSQLPVDLSPTSAVDVHQAPSQQAPLSSSSSAADHEVPQDLLSSSSSAVDHDVHRDPLLLLRS